jgi:hypothetical protein
MTEKSQLVEMFASMRAQAPWDVASDLLWGYFFNGTSEPPLRRLAENLVRMGYRLVEIRPDERRPGFWLHVERVETHSPDTLDARNKEFYQLAKEHGVTYDGMDVGPVATS